MKKIAAILACMLVCLTLFSGCTGKKNDSNPDLGNYAGAPSSVSLPDGFTYSFKEPDNRDGIVVTPKE